jgi:hypothetical protein
MNKDAVTGEEWSVTGKNGEDDGADLENWVPLSVREARKARKRREDVWPWVWMSFASVVILVITLAILGYWVEAQSCH